MENDVESSLITQKDDEFRFTPMNKGGNREPHQGKSSSIRRNKSTHISIDNLVSFTNHPFELYEGQRFTDMVESVRTNGVLVPIIVRPHPQEEGKFEILSGHNRVAAARAADLDKVTAIIREDLSDKEAMLIVTETNLIQRSFADLKHSERALVLTNHYDAIKKNPGYRSDLIEEIEKLSDAPVGHGTKARDKARDKIGMQYGLGKTTVARYLRVNKLIPALKKRLDSNDGIGMRAAEALSFLKIRDQETIEALLASGKKMSIKLADDLKEASEAGTLNKTEIKKMFEYESTPSKIRPVKLSGQFLSKHFSPEQSSKEIEDIIAKALEIYRAE